MTLLVSALLSLVLTACQGNGTAGETAAADTSAKPNIILLYADDLGYGDISCNGATKIHTPNIDRLAAEGLRFTNGHAAAATCTPSRYAILTGEYAWRKKGTGILPGDASLIIPLDRATLPSMLKKAGYATAAVGKWHLGLGSQGEPDWNSEIRPGPNETGFDYAFFFPATADRVPTVFIENHKVVALDSADPITVSYKEKVGDEPTAREHPELLKMKYSHGHDGTIVNGIGRIGFMQGGQRARWADEEVEDVFTVKAQEFIEDHRTKPFFLYLAFTDIHVPRMPDTRFKGKSGLGYRGDAILQLDWAVGRIMKTLDQLGLAKNTIVLFTSDNGPVLDDGYQDGAVEMANGHKPAGEMSGGKYSILEGGTRVPFIVRWPAAIKPGVSDALVSQVDLLASFAAFTGQSLNSADAPDSYNVMDALTGKSKQGRSTLVEQGNGLALVEGNWKYIAPHKGPKIAKNVNIALGNDMQPQLYDLKSDLAEKNNQAAAQPDRVKEMAAKLEKIRSDGRSRK
ncbi:arylsulfatase [Compostibacter hankyongensis]